MTADWLIALVAGVVGFALVSWLLTLMRQQKAPPVAIASAPPPTGSRLSVASLGEQWHRLLGVAREATPEEIEAAYHARLAECDRVRFAAGAGEADKEAARQRRADVQEAYEFIRPLRR